jgi:translation initiation factor IF-2
MMAGPKKVLTAKKPEEAKAAADAGIKGTIHKPKAAPGAAPGAGAKPGDKKSVKSEKLSSSWADDAAKKRALKMRRYRRRCARPAGVAGRRPRRQRHLVFVAPAGRDTGSACAGDDHRGRPGAQDERQGQ